MRSPTIRPSKFFVNCVLALCSASAAIASETLSPALKEAWCLVHGSQQDIVRAQKEAVSALKKNAKSAEWHELLGVACETTNAATAINETKTAASLKPLNARILTSCAVISIRVRDVQQAFDLASQAIKLDPQDGRAYAVLGMYFFLKQSILDAQRNFSKALQLSPNDFDVNALAADFYAKTLRQKETQICVERLVSKFPTSSAAHGLLAKWKNDSNDHAGAAKEFEIAAKLDPNNGYAWNKLSKALALLGKYKEAAAAATHYIELHPTRAGYFLRAGQLESAGQFQKALDDYDRVIAFPKPKPGDAVTDPENNFRLMEYKQCLIKRVEMHEKLGQTDIALAEANEILKTDPRSDAVLEFRQEIFRKQGRYLEALTDLNRLIERDQDIADWYKARAAVYTKLKKPDLAAADLAKAKHVETFGK
jgi:tetratricopeptide (TPR) repeat protein